MTKQPDDKPSVKEAGVQLPSLIKSCNFWQIGEAGRYPLVSYYLNATRDETNKTSYVVGSTDAIAILTDIHLGKVLSMVFVLGPLNGEKPMLVSDFDKISRAIIRYSENALLTLKRTQAEFTNEEAVWLPDIDDDARMYYNQFQMTESEIQENKNIPKEIVPVLEKSELNYFFIPIYSGHRLYFNQTSHRPS